MGIFGKRDRREEAAEYPIAITLEDLVRLIGRDLGDGNVQAVFARCQLVELPSAGRYGLEGNPRTFTNRDAGVEVACDELTIVTTLFLHSDGHQGYAGYRGPLVAGVTFNDTRASIRAALGPPDAFGEPTNFQYPGETGPWISG